jgi:polysaccharide pyruvyl transferase WcaK-like protein
MLEANLEELRSRIPGATFTVVSSHPEVTAKRYGVEAVAAPPFVSEAEEARERRAALAALLAQAAAGGGPPLVDAVAEANAVVLSGGGNLSSTWPDLFYERVALLFLARVLRKPAIVLGQTIGPQLGPEEAALLADALSEARFVGLRELPSLSLALGLGVAPDRLWYQTDDALLPDPPLAPARSAPGRPAIAVTIDPQVRAAGEALFGALVRQLRELATRSGARLVLIPHVFGNELHGPSDLTEARLLAERLELPETVVAAGIDAAEARRITGEASMVVSSRYHPIVFGMSAGVPSIGIYHDEYGRIKAEGALAHAGLAQWALPYEDVLRGELLTRALELWRVRDGVRGQLEARRAAWRDEHGRRWASILRALDPEAAAPESGTGMLFGHAAQELAPALAAALEARRRAWERQQHAFRQLAERCEQAEGFVRWIKARRTLRGYVSALLRRIGFLKIFRRQRSQRLES